MTTITRVDSIDDLVRDLMGDDYADKHVVAVPAAVASKMSRSAHGILCIATRKNGAVPLLFCGIDETRTTGLMYYDVALQDVGLGRVRVVKSRGGRTGGIYALPTDIHIAFAYAYDEPEALEQREVS